MKAAALLGLCALLLAGPAVAQSTPLTVAIVPSAPMASQAPDGRWTGPAIALMREAADATGRPIRFVPAPAPSNAIFPAPQGSRARMSAALTTDRLAVAGAPGGMGLLATLRAVATLQFLWVVLGLALLLLIVGAIVWAFERRESEDFRGEDGKTGGIGQGFWWTGVTMTTIGYGDLVPKTIGGRTVAMLWMLLSMGLTAALTASIVNASQASGGTAALADLVQGERVGVIGGGAAEAAVRGVGGRTIAFLTLRDALSALDAERVDRVAGSRAALNATGARSVRTTSVQLPMAVAARSGGEDFLTAINLRVTQPSWWEQVASAQPD